VFPRNPIPKLNHYLNPLIEQLDPEKQIEKEYRLDHNPNYVWRALRLVARDRLHLFQKIGHANLELLVKELKDSDSRDANKRSNSHQIRPPSTASQPLGPSLTENTQDITAAATTMTTEVVEVALRPEDDDHPSPSGGDVITSELTSCVESELKDESGTVKSDEDTHHHRLMTSSQRKRTLSSLDEPSSFVVTISPSHSQRSLSRSPDSDSRSAMEKASIPPTMSTPKQPQPHHPRFGSMSSESDEEGELKEPFDD
jgi:hypothetical protein